MSGQGGKRPKNYYTNFKKKPKGNVLVPGSKGFILTCNFQEQSAIREAYNILEEYADKLIAPIKEDEVQLPGVSKSNIEDDLEAEIHALKDINTESKRRFSQLHTGVKNVLFIQAEILDPCQLALTILEDLKKTKIQKSKYLLRLIPVLNTCKPFPENLKKTAEDALDFFLAHHHVYIEGRQVGYAVQFRARNNSKTLKKEEVFNIINSVVSEKCDTWKIALSNPELILNVDVLTNACCFGVLPDYSSYKRYNLVELVKPPDSEIKDTKDPVEIVETTDSEAKDIKDVDEVVKPPGP